MPVIEWLKRLMGRRARERHCRDCGAIVPTSEGMCPRCHSMDIEEAPPSAHQQEDSAHSRH